jgi:signal peptidase I
MTSADTGGTNSGPPRRRRAWAGFLLNLLLQPAGYVYAGAPRIALGVVGAECVVGILATLWTFYDPPGVYALLAPSAHGSATVIVAGWSMAAVLGLHAAWLCRRPPAWRTGGWRMWLLAAGLWSAPLALGLTVRMFGPVAVYSVSSRSMAPTLQEGDFVWTTGSRASCGGQRVRPGDVVALRRDGRTYVGRAIAGPGQTIAMRAASLTIDGVPVTRRTIGLHHGSPEDFGVRTRLVEETLAGGARYTVQEWEDGAPQDDLAATRVPPGFWFVLGDSRDNALDSRFKGPVAANAICGVAKKILCSRQPARIGARP